MLDHTPAVHLSSSFGNEWDSLKYAGSIVHGELESKDGVLKIYTLNGLHKLYDLAHSTPTLLATSLGTEIDGLMRRSDRARKAIESRLDVINQFGKEWAHPVNLPALLSGDVTEATIADAHTSSGGNMDFTVADEDELDLSIINDPDVNVASSAPSPILRGRKPSRK